MKLHDATRRAHLPGEVLLKQEVSNAVPIAVESLKSETCLYYRFAGHVTPEDFDTLHASEETICAGLPGDRCLGVVADFDALETIGAPLFPRLQHMRLMTDSRFCVVVVIGANSYLRALAISLGLTNDTREFVFRDTLDEALAVIQNHPRLNPAPPVTASH